MANADIDSDDDEMVCVDKTTRAQRDECIQR